MSKKSLIVYYSYSCGNTKRIAEMIQAATGADIETIETEKPYIGTYDEVVQQGQDEVNAGFMPAIKPMKANIRDYDVVYIGTPTWWYTMAPAVHSFLVQNDWVGKKVVLFMTNGGWPGHVIKDMKKSCAGAEIVASKEIRFDSTGGDHMETSEKEISDWIAGLSR